MSRTAQVERKTKETEISVKLNLDGEGNVKIDTGVGFFDHMLTAFGVHGGLDLEVNVKGDLYVDAHHTVEDTGIVIGQAIAQALGDKNGILRYGNAYIPMDEALGFCALDVSGRPFLVFDADFSDDKMGEMDTCLVEEFFRALSFNSGITLHLKNCYGKNDHHISEALFKAFAHAFKNAVKKNNNGEVLSTKGVL